MTYYDTLGESVDAARRVGWYDALDQAYRHALVWSYAAAFQPSTLLDLGSGEGAFSRLVPEDTGYVGVELRQEFVERARRDHPERTFLRADAFSEDLQPADAVVAIGTQVGSAYEVEDLVDRAIALSRRVAVLLILKDEWLATLPVSDNALSGVTEAALARQLEETGLHYQIRGEDLRTDWLVVVSRAQLREPCFDAFERAREMVPNATPGMRARLAMHMNCAATLERLADQFPDDTLVSLIRERARVEGLYS